MFNLEKTQAKWSMKEFKNFTNVPNSFFVKRSLVFIIELQKTFLYNVVKFWCFLYYIDIRSVWPSVLNQRNLDFLGNILRNNSATDDLVYENVSLIKKKLFPVLRDRTR